MRYLLLPLAACALTLPSAALAQLPPPVRAMIDAAIESGDSKAVSTVLKLARQTNPDQVAEIDEIANAYSQQQAELARQAAEEKERALADAGVLDNWTGKGEIGAFRATGNTSNTGLSGALELRRSGIDWSHKLTGRADYQRTGGVTTREKYFAAYEPRYQIDDGFFAYGLAQYEGDRFQGFDARYSVSAGAGYTVIDTDDLSLSVRGGPAYRRTEFLDGTSDTNLAGLIGADFDWAISDRIKFTQDTNVVSGAAGGTATVFIDGANTSVNLLSGLQFRVSDKVSTRLSYQVDYDSNPPAGAVSTDTLSRFTLVYGF
ncbi:YdiY family protein [Altererythrobacter sp. MTPC7]|uniref:DUF481 domain-containing protein n=1 Tax=Altererythrobacter sp. MTPC7 TaxID=3056567 RepID=UPI0036F23245